MTGEQLIPYTASPEKLKQSTDLLVIGQSSMVGEAFTKRLVDHKTLNFVVGRRVDVTKKTDWEYALTQGPVDAIVYYAAYTKVKEAQGEDRQLCLDVNVGGMQNLLETMVETGVRPHIYYVSTNLVFPSFAIPRDGKAFAEDEPIDDENISDRVYGGSKAIAERLLSEFVAEHPDAKAAIARINQPLRKDFLGKPDYLRKHLNLARDGKLYPMIDDGWVGLTDIEDFARQMMKLIQEQRSGVFHFSTTRVTPYLLLRYAVQRAKIPFDVQPVKFDELVGKKIVDPFLNPRFSDLGTALTREMLNLPEQPWQSLVDKLVTVETVATL